MKAFHLYIHIPFCVKKCFYCDFYSIPHDLEIADKYVNALRKELILKKQYAGDIKTIYIGGGTPSVLSGINISDIFDTLRNNYIISDDAEITIEANPGVIDEKKALSLLKAGVNRISIGAQSFYDEELALLGRMHTANDAINAVRSARGAGFKNISLDLIYGIPFSRGKESGGRNKDLHIKNWQYSLQKAIELSPEHISTYELTPEVNTPLYEDIRQQRVKMADEELISEMYYSAIDILKTHGYIHYEISNFARPGFECRHNLNCWNRGEYLGIGASAHSFFNGKRISNVSDAHKYIDLMSDGILPFKEECEVSHAEAIREYVFLGLRKTEGLDISRLTLLSGSKQENPLKKAVDDLSSDGLVELIGNYLRLSRKGLILSNEVIVRILLGIEQNRPS